MRKVLLATILVTLVLSVLGSLLVSARLARPINRLYREVIDAQEKKTFPHLSRTAIREVDRFAETITELNRELVTNSTKFCASWIWPVWRSAATSCAPTPAACS